MRAENPRSVPLFLIPLSSFATGFVWRSCAIEAMVSRRKFVGQVRYAATARSFSG